MTQQRRAGRQGSCPSCFSTGQHQLLNCHKLQLGSERSRRIFMSIQQAANHFICPGFFIAAGDSTHSLIKQARRERKLKRREMNSPTVTQPACRRGRNEPCRTPGPVCAPTADPHGPCSSLGTQPASRAAGHVRGGLPALGTFPGRRGELAAVPRRALTPLLSRVAAGPSPQQRPEAAPRPPLPPGGGGERAPSTPARAGRAAGHARRGGRGRSRGRGKRRGASAEPLRCRAGAGGSRCGAAGAEER